MTGSDKVILVVDDEPVMRDMLKEQLERQGFVVVQASDAFQALKELSRCHVDAMITDYQMPHLDGLDLLRECRMAWPELPVILISGLHEHIEEAALVWGAVACFPKPIDIALVVRRLQSAIEVHRKAL
jgi:DNA-binding response OmpR family regulator